MGNLKPGATYIYERQGGTVYAREMGAPAHERIVIGYDWEPENNPSRVRGASIDDIRENQLWHEIRRAAMDNKELEILLERVKLLYYLSKDCNGS
jgi:hypothetical protein